VVRDLVLRARNGDREAFASLVDATSDRMFATAYRILRDTGLAEDALQDALLIAWRQLPTLRDPDRFEAWVRRLLVHACYAQARRRQSWTANIRLLPVEGQAGPDGIGSLVDRDALERAFRRLSVEHRAVFVLHHYVGIPLVEIAETLGIPAGTARSRLHQATRTLRAAMEADMAPVVSKGRMA
jgi:RNA polymerase sigma-70 factor (ECF subfamily)